MRVRQLAEGAFPLARPRVEEALHRIESNDGVFHAVSHVSPDALQAAARSDALRLERGVLGPLDGEPVLFKGNIGATQSGLPTTAGLAVLEDSFAPEEATLVSRALAAGTQHVGNSNLTGASGFQNLLPGRSTHGQTVNAVNPTLSGSGSSTGAAAAVGAGYVRGSWASRRTVPSSCPQRRTGSSVTSRAKAPPAPRE